MTAIFQVEYLFFLRSNVFVFLLLLGRGPRVFRGRGGPMIGGPMGPVPGPMGPPMGMLCLKS